MTFFLWIAIVFLFLQSIAARRKIRQLAGAMAALQTAVIKADAATHALTMEHDKSLTLLTKLSIQHGNTLRDVNSALQNLVSAGKMQQAQIEGLKVLIDGLNRSPN